MRKIRDLFKKIGGNKGTFHAKISMIKYRNDKDLTETEDVKKRREYTEKLNKKDLNDSDNHFAFLHFFSFGMVLVIATYTVL